MALIPGKKLSAAEKMARIPVKFEATVTPLKKPAWIRVPAPTSPEVGRLKAVLRATVFEIVTIHRGNHHILQFQCCDSAREIEWFIGIERIGPAVADIAERAAPGADVAHDHEGRGALAEALADIRARGFFAHGVQLVFAQNFLDLEKSR